MRVGSSTIVRSALLESYRHAEHCYRSTAVLPYVSIATSVAVLVQDVTCTNCLTATLLRRYFRKIALPNTGLVLVFPSSAYLYYYYFNI